MDNNIKKVISTLNIVDVVSESVDLKKAGNNFKGLCPFHAENSPSFVVSPAKGIFKCFGCGMAGDLITFHMKLRKLSFVDTLKELSEKYKLGLVFADTGEKSKSRETSLQILKDASLFFKDTLFTKEGEQALIYLRDNRKLSEETIKNYYLGYAPKSGDALFKFLTSKGHNKAEILKIGLIKEKDGRILDTFWDRAIFSIFNPQGDVVGFGGRLLTEQKNAPKYLNSIDSKIFKKGYNVYGLVDRGSKLREKEYVLLTEGYTDVLACHAIGLENAVASLGTSLTQFQAKLLKKYVDNIVISYDADNAGFMAAERAIFILKKEGFSVKVASLYPAKDPDEFISSNGAEEFKKRIKRSIESFDFLFKLYSKNLSLSSPIGKKKMIEKLGKFFNSLASDLETDIYVSKLAISLDITKETLGRYMKGSHTIEKQNKVQPKLNNLERQTLMLSYKFPDYVEKLLANVELSDKITSIFRARNVNIEEAIEETLGHGAEEEISKMKQGANEIENSESFFLEILDSWKMGAQKRALKKIEDRVDVAGEDKMSLIKAYYEQKKER